MAFNSIKGQGNTFILDPTSYQVAMFSSDIWYLTRAMVCVVVICVMEILDVIVTHAVICGATIRCDMWSMWYMWWWCGTVRIGDQSLVKRPHWVGQAFNWLGPFPTKQWKTWIISVKFDWVRPCLSNRWVLLTDASEGLDFVKISEEEEFPMQNRGLVDADCILWPNHSSCLPLHSFLWTFHLAL